MSEITTVGLDLAKNVFQAHGADASGRAVLRKKLRRDQVLDFFGRLPPCVVAMEACGGAHFWGREIGKLGHEVRLIPPAYVKPFVKRQKNDAADAEAIVIAARQPEMRFVEPRTQAQQARSVLFRSRERLVHQRTELVNALRAVLYEFGLVVPQGIAHIKRIEAMLDEAVLPELVRQECLDLLQQISEQSVRIDARTKKIRMLAQGSETACRLQSMPGVGPLTALAVEAFAPDLQTFRRGRDFAAWLGLVPRQFSSGGKERLGRISKAGQADIRRLLIMGAMTQVNWASRKGPAPGSWLARMLARKPRMLVAIALANRMARAIWAMATKQEDYRDPALSVAA